MVAKEGYGLERLNVWKKALEFAIWVCKELAPGLPKEERYALADQLRRSAQSVPANIAEGYGRFYYQDNIRFCYIARGSLEETRSHLILAKELGYVTVDQIQKASRDLEVILKLINGYISYLKSEKPGSNEPGALIREDHAEYNLYDNESDLLGN